MRQGPAEINDECLDRFNYRLQNLILEGGKNIMCSLKTMDKVGDKAVPEEVTTEEENSRQCCFFYGQMNLDMDIYFNI